MRNVTGMPVRGDDFYNREQDLSRLWDLLDADNVLLLAPRRVGKTSLLYRLVDQAPRSGRVAAYVSVQGLLTETEVVSTLFEALQRFEPGRKLLHTVASSPAGRFLQQMQRVDLGVVGFEVAPSTQPPWRELGNALADAAQRSRERWLLLLDELPVFILALLRQDPTGERARQFLDWFRALRQKSPSLRWVLAGSIGLDAVVSRLDLTATIHDLVVFQLGALDLLDANGLLETLAAHYDVALSAPARKRVLARVGWLIPYHIQLLFAELRNQIRPGAPPASPDLVDQAYVELLSPAKRLYFEPWVQRLRSELGPPNDQWAILLLDAAARDPDGVSLDVLRGLLGEQISDTQPRDTTLAYLLRVLRNDGYLVQDEQRYRFRSPLVREFWQGRFTP